MDPWRRYLGATAPQALQPLQDDESPGQARSGNVADEGFAGRYTPDQGKRGDVADVADVSDERLGSATVVRPGDAARDSAIALLSDKVGAEVVCELAPGAPPEAGPCGFCAQMSVHLKPLGFLGHICEDCHADLRPMYEE